MPPASYTGRTGSAGGGGGDDDDGDGDDAAANSDNANGSHDVGVRK